MRAWLASPIEFAGDVLYEWALLLDMAAQVVKGEW